jgi:hypothetical protein
MALIHEVLELARWAPSGDNTQPWRFEIRGDGSARIHGYDTRRHCVYDLDAWASHVSHGALLETIAVAATRFGHRAEMSIEDERDPEHVTYAIDLIPASAEAAEDALAPFIRERSVQRRGMPLRRLASDERIALAESVGGFQLQLFESLADRCRLAALNARNAHIRLTIPEAYRVHAATIAWRSSSSEDRMPDASLGAGPLLVATMRYAMASWKRIDLLNRFAGGTILPRLALDVLPGVRCSAHFALIAPDTPTRLADRVAVGRAVQRLWLTATRLGLQMQPSYTPLVFARYARERRLFTESARALEEARAVLERVQHLIDEKDFARIVFLGRLGAAVPIRGRSLRLRLDKLIITGDPPARLE